MNATLSTIGPRARRLGDAVATTPGLLKTALVGTCSLALAFALAVVGGVREHRQGLRTIGKDAAPSIIAAQKIRSSLADMHANAANELLGPPGAMPEAVRAYEGRRIEVTDGLLLAAGNITYGDSERVPIRTLLRDLGRYEEAIARARLLHERLDPAALEAHREADRLVHETLLPAAVSLDEANREALDRGYAEVRSAGGRGWARVAASGLATVGALGAAQVFLFRRMRRRLNPPLIAATALTLGFLVVALGALARGSSALRVAKQDAFESIHALWRARAIAYDANGDESRWLLDRPRASTYETAFRDKAAELAGPPAGLSLAALASRVEGGDLPEGFRGYLADELRNITFDGEREAATETLRAFARYAAIDSEIRRIEGRGDHSNAVRLCLGNDPGRSNWAFARFDEALGRTLQINQEAFDREVDRGFRALDGLDVAGPPIALGIGILAVLGIRPRLREYAS